MAYYDEYSGQEVLTPEEEEEKRRRQKELADTAVHTEERKIYGDGTQEIITKKEISPEAQGLKAKPSIFENLGNAVAAMPENFVNNLKQGVTNIQNAPANFAANVQGAISPQATQAPQPTQAPVQQPAPKLDREAYNASIAQQESGARPDIGYHDRTKSSAFGMFGITAPAWQDARKRDPSLPEDITKATPEQQTAAHNIITDNNARFLAGKGIEPTPGALSAAHFAGAGGLHKYLTQKDEFGRPYISPQAQAANGGYDKAAAILNARLNGQAAPASGATSRLPQAFPGEGVAVATGNGVQGTMSMAPGPVSPQQADQQAQELQQQLQPYAQVKVPNSFDEFGTPVYSAEAERLQNHVDRFNAASGDADAMMSLGADKTVPDWMRRRARESVADLVNQERNQGKAQEAMATLGPNDMAKVLTKRSEGNSVGDWLQYLLYRHVGLNDLANEKGEQLGIGHKWATAYIQDANGKDVPVEVQTSASGRLLKGVMAGTDKALTPEQMTMAAGAIQNADNLKTAQTQAAHAYQSTQQSLLKQRQALIQSTPGITEEQLASRGLDMAGINRQSQEASSNIMTAARRQYRPAPAGTATGTSTGAVNAPAGPAPQAPQEQTFKTASGKPSILDNWGQLRTNEGAKAKEARNAILPTEIDDIAQGLVNGSIATKDITGRNSDFKRLATDRALEIDPTYNSARYGQVDNIIKRYTSGKDHETLVNIGTAANHLLAYKDAAERLPESQKSDVSAWNSFMQKYSKYGNAPAFKDKEAMAGFVAGEMVKAATGGQGTGGERMDLEKKLMAANTPAEWNAVINGQLELASGRYNELKGAYERGTKRKDFDDTVGIGGQAAKEFERIHAQKIVKDQGSDAEKWARANPNDPRSAEILKRLGKK